MTASPHAKTLDGVTILAREAKRDPKSMLASDGGPAWRPIVAQAKPAYESLTHTCTPNVVITPAQVTEGWTVAEKPLADAQAALKDDINRQAFGRIIAILPEYKQRNYTARATELSARQAGTWVEDDGTQPTARALTAQERTEAQAMSSAWKSIAAIRDASNIANTAIDAARDVTAAKAAYDAVVWP